VLELFSFLDFDFPALLFPTVPVFGRLELQIMYSFFIGSQPFELALGFFQLVVKLTLAFF
jgi:hypothetical protein